MNFCDELKLIAACPPAVKWVGDRTRNEAWQDCERADWMLWLLARMAGWLEWPSRAIFLHCVADCAATARPYMAENGLSVFDAAIAAIRAMADNPGEKNLSRAVYAAVGAAWVTAHNADAGADDTAVGAVGAAGAAWAATHNDDDCAAWAATHHAAWDDNALIAHQTMCELIRKRVATLPDEEENNDESTNL